MRSDLELVLSAERRLLDPAVRGDAAQLEQLLDSGFTEIGASGRIWNRADLIADLVASPNVDETLTADMSARHVSEEVIVVEYTTSTPARTVRRASWWRRQGDAWCCYYHQGTVLTRP